MRGRNRERDTGNERKRKGTRNSETSSQSGLKYIAKVPIIKGMCRFLNVGTHLLSISNPYHKVRIAL